MKEKIWTILGGIGMITLLAGASAMDSENMAIPVVMVIIGLVLFTASARVLEPEKA